MRVMGFGLAMLGLACLMGGTAQAAGSKCDAALTKAAGKKVFCKAKVNATAQKKGTTPDAAKLQKCSDKFDKACTKAQTKYLDCTAQTQTCAQIEAEADSCVTDLSGSPSSAFLD